MSRKVGIEKTLLMLVMVSLPSGAWAGSSSGLELPISNELEKIVPSDRETFADANRMMGHLDLAAESMDMKMKGSSEDQLARAEKICMKLLDARPEVIDQYEFRAGKKAVVVDDEETNYYVPVVDDVTIDGDFQEKATAGKSPRIEEKGLQIVHFKMKLNLKNVRAAIHSSENSVKAGKFTEAKRALDQAFKKARVSEKVMTNPVWSVWSNFVLSKDFLSRNQFESARFALKAAENDLSQIEKESVLKTNGSEAKALQTQLTQLEQDLDKKDPTTVEKIRATLGQWSEQVKHWL